MPSVTLGRVLALLGLLLAVFALLGVAANVPLIPIALVLIALAIMVP